MASEVYLVKSREYAFKKDSTGREDIIACYANQHDAQLRAEAEIRHLYRDAHLKPPIVLLNNDTQSAFVDLKGTPGRHRVLIHVVKIECQQSYQEGAIDYEEEETDIEIDEQSDGEKQLPDQPVHDPEELETESEEESEEEDIRPDPLTPLRSRPATSFTPINSSPLNSSSTFNSPLAYSYSSPFLNSATRTPGNFSTPPRNSPRNFNTPPHMFDAPLRYFDTSPLNATPKRFNTEVAPATPKRLKTEAEAVPASSDLDNLSSPQFSSPSRETVIKQLTLFPASFPKRFELKRKSEAVEG